MAIFDAGATLMPHGTYSTNQSFPGIQLYPRQLAGAVLIHMLVRPTASAVFTIEEASTAAGAYSVIGTHVWPAGVVGSKKLEVPAGSSRAAIANNTASWVRLTLTTTTSFTGSVSVTRQSDGGPGLGSRSYALDNINAL
jgi:hypothetical protein